jgi:hypothetical protein
VTEVSHTDVTPSTLSKAALRDIAKTTPFKLGKFVNLDPSGVEIMGQEHSIQQALNNTLSDQWSPMQDVIDDIQKVKDKKIKLITNLKENDIENANTNLRLEFLHKKIHEMNK